MSSIIINPRAMSMSKNLTYTQYAEVPMSKNFEPFQIIFVMDGSGSMTQYYNTMIKIYNKLFSGMENVQGFQFSSQIGPLEPFIGGGTDIQIAMERLTEILENGLPQSNVCTVFVSDGCGHENVETLKARYLQLQRKYQIIFISIAVGGSFPAQLSTKLRNMIHNGQSSVPAVLEVTENDQFEEQFKKILNYSQQQKKIQTKNNVLRNPWEGPTNIVCPGEVVAVNNNDTVLTALDGRTYIPNLTPPLTYKFIYGSLQLLIQLCTNNHPDKKTYIDMMLKYIYEVRQLLEDTRAIHKIALYVDLGKAVLFLESILNGQIDLQKIGDKKLQEIMVENNPEKNQNNDSNQSDTSQKLFKEAQLKGANIRTLEELFTKENKLQLLGERYLYQRLQKFIQICSRDNQTSTFVQNNQQLAYQLIDSQLLFNR